MPGPSRDQLVDQAAAVGSSLDPGQADQLLEYWRLLVKWNQRINLTALPIAEPTEAAIGKLLIEPLAAERLIEDAAIRWADLGSGGGSPAIPLKIMKPRAVLTMVESRGRKATFLREAVRTLGLAHATVSEERVEAFGAAPGNGGRFGLVTVRALAMGPEVVHAIARLLTSSGALHYFGGAAPPAIDGFMAVQHRYVAGTNAVVHVFKPLELGQADKDQGLGSN